MPKSNGNSFFTTGFGMDDKKVRSLAPPMKWGLPIPDFGLMGRL